MRNNIEQIQDIWKFIDPISKALKLKNSNIE